MEDESGNHLEDTLEDDDDDDDDDDTTTVGDGNGVEQEDNEEDDDETSSEPDDRTSSPHDVRSTEAMDVDSPDSSAGQNDEESPERPNDVASDNDSEPPKPAKMKAMRIKLKMPKAATGASAKSETSKSEEETTELLAAQSRKPQNQSSSSSGKGSVQSQPLKKKPRLVLHPGLSRKKTGASSSSMTGNAASSEAGGSAPATTSDKSKSRIRSLKLPLSNKSAGETVQATVVNSDDDDEVEGVSAVATVVSSSTVATPSTSANKVMGKRRMGPLRIRIPPLLSPGLRVLLSQSSKQHESYSTPSEIFDQAMASAGYTVEARTQNPHRGSSTDRVVGDMFDSNVKLSLHFPPLVPHDLWGSSSKTETNSENGKMDSYRRRRRLVDSLRSAKNKLSHDNGKDSSNKKRTRKQWSFRDMLPVTLTIPYPETYIDQRLDYVRQVQEREKAIIRRQETEVKEENDESPSKKVEVPPIPQQPPAPTFPNQSGFLDDYEGNHPFYIPKSRPHFVAHLDKRCFHISEGRYFGLWTNTIADPNFVGPNAPGITGVNSAAGAGLATCTSGTGSTSTALTLTSSFHTREVPTSSVVTSDLVTSTESKVETESPPSKKAPPEKKSEKKPAPVESPKNQTIPTPTASNSSLRKVMEEGGSSASVLRRRIIRAAVHASRTGNHGRPFTAGEKVYPDIGKAFAAHAGIKPCMRCKNNKQGAYHCRLRRKHFDNDFDGGDSMGELKPLFEIPMKELLVDDGED